MNTLHFVVVVLLVIASTSFFYKIYLHTKIVNPAKRYSLFSRIYDITDFLPMRTKYRPENEIKMRKKANFFLAIFYLCFILTLLLSLID